MSSRTAPWDATPSHLSPQNRPDGITAQDPKTINALEDAERFCAYRSHRYGQSPALSRAVLLQVSQAQAVEGFPGSWYLDLEPLGTTRPGAQDTDGHAGATCAGSLGGEPGGVLRAEEGWLPIFRDLFSAAGGRWSSIVVTPRSRRPEYGHAGDIRGPVEETSRWPRCVYRGCSWGSCFRR